MRAKTKQRIASVVAAVGAIFILAALLLPYVKIDQTMAIVGPATSYDGSDYTISNYFIPPIDAGQNVAVVISGYKPGSIFLSFFPTADDSLSPAAAPIFMVTNSSSPTFSAEFVSPKTQPYGAFVVSSNHTSFVLGIRSKWSPFYFLKSYMLLYATMAIAGAAGSYLYGLARRREEEFDHATAGLPHGGKASQKSDLRLFGMGPPYVNQQKTGATVGAGKVSDMVRRVRLGCSVPRIFSV